MEEDKLVNLMFLHIVGELAEIGIYDEEECSSKTVVNPYEYLKRRIRHPVFTPTSEFELKRRGFFYICGRWTKYYRLHMVEPRELYTTVAILVRIGILKDEETKGSPEPECTLPWPREIRGLIEEYARESAESTKEVVQKEFEKIIANYKLKIKIEI